MLRASSDEPEKGYSGFPERHGGRSLQAEVIFRAALTSFSPSGTAPADFAENEEILRFSYFLQKLYNHWTGSRVETPPRKTRGGKS
jgi:hypothetical protein